MILVEVLENSRFDPSASPVENLCRVRVNGTGRAVEKVFPCAPAQGPFASVFRQFNPVQTAYLRLASSRPISRMVLATPTSSGKSLIAYMFLANRPGIKVYAVPRKAIADEKGRELAAFFGPERVEVRSGDFIPEERSRVPREYLVCTYEYLALAARNRSGWLWMVRAAAFDEIHVLYGGHSAPDEALWWALESGVPFICLSATIPGLEKLANHVMADAVLISEWRPVPLERKFLPLFSGKGSQSAEGVAYACAERIVERVLANGRVKQTLVFVPSKKVGWLTLNFLSRMGFDPVNEEAPDVLQKNPDCPKVAFHCADLSREERQTIEEGVRRGEIPVLLATSTLAYGVNLPAEQVLVVVVNRVSRAGLELWPSLVDCIQMEGRAGRFGLCERGRVVYLIQNKKSHVETRKVLEDRILSADLKPEEDQADFYVMAAVLRKAPLESLSRWSFVFKETDPLVFRDRLEFLKIFGFIKESTLTRPGKFCFHSGLGPAKLVEFALRLKALRAIGDPPVLRPLAVSAIHKKQQLERNRPFQDQLRIHGQSASHLGLVDFLSRTAPAHAPYTPRARAEEAYSRFLDALARTTPEGFQRYGRPEVGRRAGLDEVLGYVTGAWVMLGISRVPGAYGWLRHECYYLARMLCELRKLAEKHEEFSFFTWRARDILEVLHSLAFGLPPELAWIGGVPGIGHVQGTLISHVFYLNRMDAGITPRTTGEELLRRLDLAAPGGGVSLETMADLYARACKRRGRSTEPERLVASIRRALEKHGEKPLVDEKILSWVFQFTTGRKMRNIEEGLEILNL